MHESKEKLNEMSLVCVVCVCVNAQALTEMSSSSLLEITQKYFPLQMKILLDMRAAIQFTSDTFWGAVV